MSTDLNLQVRLKSRPHGWPTVENFDIGAVPQAPLADGQFRVRINFLSLDPYMRGRMNDAKSYAAKVELGDVMVGGAVGEIVESQHARFPVGQAVVGSFGWQEYAISDGKGVMPVDAARSIYLGPAGMPGVTAWIGLNDFGQPKAGETVVVSAAAGAVGSVVGQLAKLAGCRAVGIAGGPDKCRHVVEDLGFDACVDYKAGALRDDLKAATPNGIDVYFENVGGEILEEVARRLNAFARIPLCGLISQYNATAPQGFQNFGALLINRVRLQGFIVSEHLPRWPAALTELRALIDDKKLHYRETIVDGLANAPTAFLGLLRGDGLGKMLIRVA